MPYGHRQLLAAIRTAHSTEYRVHPPSFNVYPPLYSDPHIHNTLTTSTNNDKIEDKTVRCSSTAYLLYFLTYEYAVLHLSWPFRVDILSLRQPNLPFAQGDLDITVHLQECATAVTIFCRRRRRPRPTAERRLAPTIFHVVLFGAPAGPIPELGPTAAPLGPTTLPAAIILQTVREARHGRIGSDGGCAGDERGRGSYDIPGMWYYDGRPRRPRSRCLAPASSPFRTPRSLGPTHGLTLSLLCAPWTCRQLILASPSTR